MKPLRPALLQSGCQAVESIHGCFGCSSTAPAALEASPEGTWILRCRAKTVTPARRVVKLGRVHGIEGFDCGSEQLNRYLVRYAWQNQQAGAAQTYVGLVGETIIGFYTLAVGHVSHAEVPERLTKGLARHPVPIMLLARLAVDRRWQGHGVGKALVRDAMLRTLQAAEIAGIRAFAVHAKDRKPGTFTSISISSRPRPIRCICSSC